MLPPHALQPLNEHNHDGAPSGAASQRESDCPMDEMTTMLVLNLKLLGLKSTPFFPTFILLRS
jgi:hypothetical protein